MRWTIHIWSRKQCSYNQRMVQGNVKQAHGTVASVHTLEQWLSAHLYFLQLPHTRFHERHSKFEGRLMIAGWSVILVCWVNSLHWIDIISESTVPHYLCTKKRKVSCKLVIEWYSHQLYMFSYTCSSRFHHDFVQRFRGMEFMLISTGPYMWCISQGPII